MPGTLTARDLGERIQAGLGRAWDAGAGDGLRAGSADTIVSGIVTAWTPSIDVLHRAVAAGANTIVTRECPYWSREAEVKGYSGAGATATQSDMKGDPAFVFKQSFIEKNRLVLWRLSANWDAHTASAPVASLAAALGWQQYAGVKAGRYVLPSTSLGALAAAVRKRLSVRGLRVLGAPDASVSRVALSRGFLLVPEVQALLGSGEVDVFVAGEPVEWEAFPYVADLVTAGRAKGMILLGHAVSEEPGLADLAKWLESVVTGVPVRFVPAGEPFTAVRS